MKAIFSFTWDKLLISLTQNMNPPRHLYVTNVLLPPLKFILLLLPYLFAKVVEPECEKSSATTYFWYRQTLNITSSIDDTGGLNWKMTLSLLVAWILVCLAVIKGIQSSGKVPGVGSTGLHRNTCKQSILRCTCCSLDPDPECFIPLFASAFQSIRKILKHINNSSGSPSLFLHDIMKYRHTRMQHQLAGASGGCNGTQMEKRCLATTAKTSCHLDSERESRSATQHPGQNFNREERTLLRRFHALHLLI